MGEDKRRNIWQIAGGEPSRDYSELFVKHDLMLIGPGRFGPYDGERFEKAARADGRSAQKIGMVRSFAERVVAGDIMLLRTRHRVKSIGLVHDSPYEHSEAFDDVFGWDLQHTRRVMWQQNLEAELGTIQGKCRELYRHMKQIPTLTRVKDAKVLAPIQHLFERCKARRLRPLSSKPPEPLTLDQLGTLLFAKGLPNEWVDRTITAIQRQRRLAHWYAGLDKRTSRPQEHEVVAHMVLPLLLALGWSEQLLAVEWHRIDLAAFAETPTTQETCVLVCEAKGLGHGVQSAFEQARRYVCKLKLDRCSKILLTDGQRLYLYHRTGKDADFGLVGYVNIDKIRTDHVAPAGTNAVDTIVALTPTRVERELSGKR